MKDDNRPVANHWSTGSQEYATKDVEAQVAAVWSNSSEDHQVPEQWITGSGENDDVEPNDVSEQWSTASQKGEGSEGQITGEFCVVCFVVVWRCSCCSCSCSDFAFKLQLSAGITLCYNVRLRTNKLGDVGW